MRINSFSLAPFFHLTVSSLLLSFSPSVCLSLSLTLPISASFPLFSTLSFSPSLYLPHFPLLFLTLSLSLSIFLFLWYSDIPGAGSLSDCFNCPAKFYCPLGSVEYIACPGKHYCPMNSMNATICSAGGYCPPDSAAPVPCPASYFCPVGVDKPLRCHKGKHRNEKQLLILDMISSFFIFCKFPPILLIIPSL